MRPLWNYYKLMKKEEEIIRLFKRYLANECSEEETKSFLELFHSKEHESFFKELIDAELSKKADAEFKNMPNIKAELSQVREKVIQETTPSFHREPIQLKLWSRRIVVAAMLILCSSAGLYFYLRNQTSNNGQLVGDIGPGSNKALLTLADGSQIVLDEALKGNLTNQNGVRITKADDGQLVYTINETAQAQNLNDGSGKMLTNTISTPRGGQYQVNLPDGTRVWLNAESVIKFPISFVDLKERRVELQGEAYFEVEKDATKPFFVSTDKQEVRVLGTHFNISSYKNELDTKTTLLEGSVKVRLLNTKRVSQKVLKPGDQSQIRATSAQINVVTVDPQSEIAWKNGRFFFENEPIEDIMKQIKRWYDVDVEYEDNMAGKTIWGSVTRYGNVSKVLSVLESTGGVHFKIEGRRIIVRK
ncbi:FecR family protein [Pedobacter hiemivivus]|uniref:FecR family protein n=2 Tax=Pedobacter hiemivivus TaxID=2530454 RepID=A0A4R0NJ26_9SPHI|nr:FecR family protein [Pedobacter hiemivivus]